MPGENGWVAHFGETSNRYGIARILEGDQIPHLVRRPIGRGHYPVQAPLPYAAAVSPASSSRNCRAASSSAASIASWPDPFFSSTVTRDAGERKTRDVTLRVLAFDAPPPFPARRPAASRTASMVS